MLYSIAWKNIWRNKLRSLVVIFSVIIGLMAGAFAIAFMNGLTKQRTKSIIYNEVSHIQIHHPHFQDNNEAKYFIKNAEDVKEYISSLPEVKSICGRMLIQGMASTSGGNSGGIIYGIIPEEEKEVTEIYQFVNKQTGDYFEHLKKNQVLISEKMAKNLKLDRYLFTDSTLIELDNFGFPSGEADKLKGVTGERFRSSKDYLQKLREIIGEELTNEYEYLFLKYAIQFKNRASIILTFQDSDGDLTGGKFKITGIYKTKNTAFDEFSLFVRITDLSRLTHYPKADLHELAVLLTDKELAAEVAEKIKIKYPDLKVDTWGEINPELVMLSEYMGIYNYIIIAIILAALAFGIINTMLMSIMERTKELGMLAAIGMNRKRIFNMIMLETIFLTLIGAIIALTMNFFLMMRLSKTGVDMTKSWGQGIEAIGYDPVIFPEIGIQYYIGITVMVIVVAILSSIYPAVKAIKLNPAEAVRSDA